MPPSVDLMWDAVAGEPMPTAVAVDRPTIEFTGPATVLPSVFDVTTFATAAIGVASAAVAEHAARPTGKPVAPVQVDRRAAAAAFLGEALFEPLGWERPAIWDPVAGDYRAGEQWIRLHTNYRHHRAAAEAVLGPLTDKADTAAAVAGWSADDLESAVVAAGGCAAVMRSHPEWSASAAGAAAATEPLVRVVRRSGEPPRDRAGSTRRSSEHSPLRGIRVLDLTRVIAGPVATRFLAGYGADVLRIDPPGFEEVGALLPETTLGKRCATLDLSQPADRERFEALVRTADVLVCGLRPDALVRLGFGPDVLGELNPTLITAALDAYGWAGPWAGRRGFDSLVQMSCGIAAAGAEAAGQDRPRPLPAQALDHGTGYLLAAAVVRALTRQRDTGETSTLQLSLVGTANQLMGLPAPADGGPSAPTWSAADTVPTATAWGPARRVPLPRAIVGTAPHFAVAAGELGRHEPRWEPDA